MSNLNKGYYPTNKNLCNELVKGLTYYAYHTILEPSAGKGHIADFIKEWGGRNAKYDIDCIELDNERRAILKEKGYKVVYDDFLDYETTKKYDLIIMNPPFEQGAKHLLHAISLQEKFGGRIRCILNAETIRNTFSNERKILKQKLSDYNAKIEFIENSFNTSETERKTDVEIAIIDVEVVGSLNKQLFNEKNMNKNVIDEDIIEEDKEEVMAKETITQKVERYKQEVRECKEFYELYTNKIQRYHAVKVVLSDDHNRFSQSTSWNNILKTINRKYWEELFLVEEFTDKLTVEQKDKWRNRIEDLQYYEFSLFNINEIKGEILKNAYKGLEDMAIKLFERFTSEYYTEGSNKIHYYNGWEMNKAYVVGDKVKSVIKVHDGYSFRSWYCDYNSVEVLNSVDKVLDLFNNGEIKWDGDSCGKIVRDACVKASDSCDDTLVKDIETKYAILRCYKKNTVDFIFKKEAKEIIKRFNIFGSKQKGWLPQTFGSFSYNEADFEEKEVLNNFYKAMDKSKKGKKDYSCEYEKDRTNNAMTGILMIEMN